MVSPGVYTKIQPLESYVQEIPGSTGFIVGLASKGPDNKLTFVASLEQFDKLFGKPDLRYGKYAHAQYIARSFMKVSPSMYYIRPLPDDATYANIVTFLFLEKEDSLDTPKFASTPVKYVVESINITNKNNIDSLSVNPTKYPQLLVKDSSGNVYEFTVGTVSGTTATVNIELKTAYNPDLVRDYVIVFDQTDSQYKAFNKDGVMTGININPDKRTEILYNGVKYRLEFDGTNFIWNEVDPNETKSQYDEIIPLFIFNGKYRGEWYNKVGFEFEVYENNTSYIVLNTYEDDIQTRSFNVSFDPNAKDENEQNIYIKDILENFHVDLGISLNDDEYEINKIKATNKLKASNYTTQVNGIITDITETDGLPVGSYFIGDRVGGWLTTYAGKILHDLDVSSKTFSSETPVAFGEVLNDGNKLYIHAGNGVVYEYDPYTFIVLNSFLTTTYLNNGSDGSLITSYGTVDSTVANSLISQGYVGDLDPDVKNTEFYWIDLVLDAGYSRDIKTQIVNLVKVIRRDCIALLDNGDNYTAQQAINKRLEENYFNTEYAALYEPYIKIKDTLTGKSLWISPIYSVAKLFALNDKINETWYAVAGFTRGSDSEIMELRYSPLLGERDQFYLNQINPFVKFKEGNVLWGQLTTRRKSDALQNVNVMRVILYVKRAIEQFLKYEIFEFNDTETRNRIENAIKQFLTDVQRRRGLYDFSVRVWADEYHIKNKSAVVEVILYPTRPIERFFLNFFIK